jgi:hypothetical protein
MSMDTTRRFGAPQPARGTFRRHWLASSHLAMSSPTRDGARRPPARYVTALFDCFISRVSRMRRMTIARRVVVRCVPGPERGVRSGVRGDATARARATRIGFD